MMTPPANGPIVALILAGGEARRLGRTDKPLLTVGGRPILARLITALALPEIAISARDEDGRFAAFGSTVLGDGRFAGCGPLAGVLAGLAWAQTRGAAALLTVPGDTPFIPPDLATTLRPAPSCAASGGRVHHLVALWPVEARNRLESFLTHGASRRVADFSRQLGMRAVDFPIGTCDPFLNVNTPEDLRRARTLAERDTSAAGADANPAGPLC